MPNTSKGPGDISSLCGPAFASLDKWLLQVATDKGDDAARFVKEAFQNNIRANIQYYEYLGKAAEGKREDEMAVRNRLVAKLYKGFAT